VITPPLGFWIAYFCCPTNFRHYVVICRPRPTYLILLKNPLVVLRRLFMNIFPHRVRCSFFLYFSYSVNYFCSVLFHLFGLCVFVCLSSWRINENISTATFIMMMIIMNPDTCYNALLRRVCTLKNNYMTRNIITQLRYITTFSSASGSLMALRCDMTARQRLQLIASPVCMLLGFVNWSNLMATTFVSAWRHFFPSFFAAPVNNQPIIATMFFDNHKSDNVMDLHCNLRLCDKHYVKSAFE